MFCNTDLTIVMYGYCEMNIACKNNNIIFDISFLGTILNVIFYAMACFIFLFS